MRLTSKCQVSTPQAVRSKAGLPPHCGIKFEVGADSDVLMRRAAVSASPIGGAFEQVFGCANAAQVKAMGTGESVVFIRG